MGRDEMHRGLMDFEAEGNARFQGIGGLGIDLRNRCDKGTTRRLGTFGLFE